VTEAPPDELRQDELRQGWPAILACFATALFAWGFGLYGQSVLLAGLQASRGWPTALISTATTFYYLAGAALIVLAPWAMVRLGPRRMLLGGALLLGLGATVTANATAPWHMFAGALLMAAGWAGSSSTAIATTLALWFDRKRGLAISLALNGASASGFTVGPLLVAAQEAIGLDRAVPLVAGLMFVVLVPLALWGTSRPIRAGGRVAGGGQAGAREMLGDPRFWHVAGPFAIGLVAQVAMLVHLVALLLPRLGVSGAGLGLALVSLMAMLGRVVAGLVVDRMNLRVFSGACFASQAAAVMLMAVLPEAGWAQIAGCVGFGLSVGNVITLPSLLIQREFAPARFGALVGLSTAIGQVAYAFAPALAGVVHDLASGYTPVLLICAALQLLAAVAVLPRIASSAPRA
jgi:MFS family permease